MTFYFNSGAYGCSQLVQRKERHEQMTSTTVAPIVTLTMVNGQVLVECIPTNMSLNTPTLSSSVSATSPSHHRNLSFIPSPSSPSTFSIPVTSQMDHTCSSSPSNQNHQDTVMSCTPVNDLHQLESQMRSMHMQ